MIRYVSDAPNAPKAIGPYSQATVVGNLAFLSGQIPIDPEQGSLVAGGVEAQAEQVMKNIQAVLRHLRTDLSEVVRTSIYLTDLSAFAVVNKIYERWMGGKRPARSTIQVAGLPLGALIEIEVVAEIPVKAGTEKGGVFY